MGLQLYRLSYYLQEFFLLTYLYNILQIQLVNPVELLHGGNQGGERAEEQMAACDRRCGGTWQWLLDCTYNRGTVRSTFEILCCSGLCDYWNLCTFLLPEALWY